MYRARCGRKLFPAIFIHLISFGEASGRLAHMLSQAASQQEFVDENRIRLLAGIVEPAVFVEMGIIVLLIVRTNLQPIVVMNMLIRV